MKTITTYNPNKISLFDEMDSLLNSFIHDKGSSELAGRMNVDIHEDEKGYHLEADLPGFSEKDIDIEIKDSLLIIQGNVSRNHEEKEAKYIVRERSKQRFQRSFVLPTDADLDKISASMKNGVLNLEIEKKAEAKPKKIQIK